MRVIVVFAWTLVFGCADDAKLGRFDVPVFVDATVDRGLDAAPFDSGVDAASDASAIDQRVLDAGVDQRIPEVDHGVDLGSQGDVFVSEAGQDSALPDAEPDAQCAQEVCNGRDDDCDARTDEIFEGLGEPCFAGQGACLAEGRVVCNAEGLAAVCDAEAGQGGDEVCNGLDDDCDGPVDEQLPPVSCYGGPQGTELNGVCRSGQSACVSGERGPCVGEVLPGDEQCGEGGGNQLDDDCNGATDEGCVCRLGEEQACGRVEGECRLGRQICGEQGFGPCIGAVGPMEDLCNGLDDDCDGRSDQAFPLLGLACNVGVGACRRPGTYVCGPVDVQCSAQAGVPGAEQCNGADDDCDGRVDEGLTQVCGTDVGVCEAGLQACSLGAFGVCVGGVEARAEACDRRDDDCDGRTDEGVQNACGACGPVPGERCNGADDDCDGLVDESFQVGQACLLGQGICQRESMLVCLPDGRSGCPAMPGMPEVEVCDGLDNDCNGFTDEDYVPVDDCNAGECRLPAEPSQCLNGRVEACMPGRPLEPGEEVCGGALCEADCRRNLLRDGGFEAGYSFWAAVVQFMGQPEADFAIDDRDFRRGRFSARIDNRLERALYGVQLMQGPVPIEGGRRYVLTFLARADWNQADPAPVVAVDVGMGRCNYCTVARPYREVGVGREWGAHHVIVEGNRDESHAVVTLNMGRTEGTYWFDEVSLVECPDGGCPVCEIDGACDPLPSAVPAAVRLSADGRRLEVDPARFELPDGTNGSVLWASGTLRAILHPGGPIVGQPEAGGWVSFLLPQGTAVGQAPFVGCDGCDRRLPLWVSLGRAADGAADRLELGLPADGRTGDFLWVGLDGACRAGKGLAVSKNADGRFIAAGRSASLRGCTLPNSCNPFVLHLVGDGQPAAGRIRWHGDGEGIVLRDDNFVAPGDYPAPRGACSATLEADVRGVDRARSTGEGSVVPRRGLCNLPGGGFGMAHNGGCVPSMCDGPVCE